MKERLDIILVNKGLAPSREKAKAMIMAGSVYVNGQKENKAGSGFDPEAVHVEIRDGGLKYVGRGGLKLEKAMEEWKIPLKGAVCMDIGASTGGFTDCMLQYGAAKVYSIDVGYGQLNWKLRKDERVVCMEKTNFRHISPYRIGEEIDFAAVDVSFISLTKILLPARNLLKSTGKMVCLIKPQFEAGKEKVGKKGVVREPSVHEEVIKKIIDFAYSIGFDILNLDYSPIKGPEGNLEYLIYLQYNSELSKDTLDFGERDGEQNLAVLMDEGIGYSNREEWKSRIRDVVTQAHIGDS